MDGPSPPRSPGAPRSSLWRDGAVVGGRYRLRVPLGAGAMGEVWRADHVTLGTGVAVKLVDTGGRPDATEILGRFELEARAAAQLRSPHVVQILDHGADGRVAFMVMELLDGESLEHRLQRRGTLTPSETAHLLREMARGVDRAHAAGIVHRDLKPPNVFIARIEGVEVVKVLDFGIAKMLGTPRDAHLQTQAGMVVGTPAYMSPEQVLGRPVDHRSDLWQLAVIAFECMTGRRPFDGETLGQLFMAVCTLPMPVPSAFGPVPPAFDAWFARAASRDPARRFGSAGEMAEALGAVLAPGGVGESAVATVATSGSRPGGTDHHAVWSAARPPPRRTSKGAIVAGFLLAPTLGLLVGGAWWLLAHRAPAAPSSTPLAQPPASVSSGEAPSPAITARSPTQPSASPAATDTATAAPSAKASAERPRPSPRSPSNPRPGAAKPPVDLGI